MAENRVIGINNTLPWRLPADLKHFRNTTTGHAILMGRKTYESFGKPLPNRTHVIITSEKNYPAPPGGIVVNSVQAALKAVEDNDEIFIVGGASLYSQTLPYAHRLYLTLIHATVKGDAYFPEFDLGQWRERARENHEADLNNSFAYSFVTLDRIAPPPRI